MGRGSGTKKWDEEVETEVEEEVEGESGAKKRGDEEVETEVEEEVEGESGAKKRDEEVETEVEEEVEGESGAKKRGDEEVEGGRRRWDEEAEIYLNKKRASGKRTSGVHFPDGYLKLPGRLHHRCHCFRFFQLFQELFGKYLPCDH